MSSIKDSLLSKWCRVESPAGIAPKPRHGHRAVNVKDMMIVFGGGNEGIVDELHIYKTSSNQWFNPGLKGDIPPGCAAYGITTDGNRVFIFGGMVEYGRYSNDLYELKVATWEWKKIRARTAKNVEPPRARLGHSFTIVGNKIFLFGGLANDSDNPKQNMPKYLNDLYVLELKNSIYQWDMPSCTGEPPTPRESHTAVAFTPRNGPGPKLLIYGGMSGFRLGDICILDIPTMTWSKIDPSGSIPFPRSLHTATVINQKMYIFGGWVPVSCNTDSTLSSEKLGQHHQEKEWKCTNTLACLNLDTMHWEFNSSEISDDVNVPRARAGHSAVAIGSRLYIWSGRDGYRKAWNNQVCCRDLWYLETEKPSAPVRIQLVKATTSTFEITWGSVANADCYIVQIQKMESPDQQAGPIGSTAAMKKPMLPPATNPLPTPPVPSTLSTTPVASTASSVAIAPTAVSIAGISSQVPGASAAQLLPNATLLSTTPTASPIKVYTIPKTQTTVSNLGHNAQIVTASTTTVPAPTTMSGMAALAAAAAATPRITTKTSAVSTASNIRILTPTVQLHPTTSSSSPATGIKLTPSASTSTATTPQQIRFITTSSVQSGTKQIFIKGNAGGAIQTSQLISLAKSSNGTLHFVGKIPNTGVTGQGQQQIVKIITQNPSKPVTVSVASTSSSAATLTTTDPTSSAGTANTQQAKIINTPTNVKMIVLPNSSRSGQQLVLAPQTSTSGNTQTSGSTPMVLNKSIKIPVSAIRNQTVQGGASKLVISGSHLQSNSIRLIQSNNNRVVLVQSTQPTISTTGSTIITTTAATTIAQPINTVVTATKIPQSDGPEDEEPKNENSAVTTSADEKQEPPSSDHDPKMTDDQKPETDKMEISEPTSSSTVTTTTTSTITTTATTTTATPTIAKPTIVLVANKKAENATPMHRPSNAAINNNDNYSVSQSSKSTSNQPQQQQDKWYDVGIFKTNSCSITNFLVPNDDTVNYDAECDFDSKSCPQYAKFSRVYLEPGTSYRIRVAAVNLYGRGPWSSGIAFKTCFPGFPPAPTSIKITKSLDGAHISWAIPPSASKDITEYTVYLGVKTVQPPPIAGDSSSFNPSPFAFAKVYCGPQTEAMIPSRVLIDAYIDQEASKPAIIFRIAAKNEKGYGPATQVRWLQETSQSQGASSASSLANKRPFSQNNDLTP
ncbi:Kelch domain containing Galactose oxidase-like protein [Euroglyphus maynei]|uniref:Kelch domain containing Galactose oxidase-like protein n=1 Tax=Euroglyphus maynei TaxID=6958 RepID=A0A1Y3AYW0_EURMA|nr:Kelch domain containing Galactose oxidase-like protein [Euroglyphus maynei]